MKTKIMVTAGLAGCLMAAWAAKDPVVMTVNGVDVPKSEFEYLYKKNNQQQIGSQSIDEYAEMFKIYKLKVADAIAEGIDTTKAFKDEFLGYRSELAAPYMVDSLYIRQLEREAYERAKEEVAVSHIMIYKSRDTKKNNASRQQLDSIRNVLIQGADFSELAKKYSQDRSAATNGGYLGYITSMIYPYGFESAAYSLKPGEISTIVESPVAYHILKGGAHRLARGKVHVAHILKMVQPDAPDSLQARAKMQIDTIYSQAVPGNFAALASLTSDDKGSAGKGGDIPWFGTGQMVPEFDSVAFALKPGEISKPFRSPFGWHIIHKIEAAPLESYEAMESKILARVTNPNDDRAKLIKKHQQQKIEKEYKGKRNEKEIAAMRQAISVNGLDSLVIARYTSAPLSERALYTYGKGEKMTCGDLMNVISHVRVPNTETALTLFDEQLEATIQKELFDYEESMLADKFSDFRNLVNEYHDGMLLFEVSNRKVWDKAAKDTEGLDKYFKSNINDYKWKEPHVKGYLVQAESDSVATLVKGRMAELAPDTLVRTIRKEFAKKVQIDKVLVAKGSNGMVDNIVFGGPEVKPSNSKYSVYFLYDFKVLDNPEEVNDVRGLVTSDYQNLLESEWIEELKSKYPVNVNRKELQKIK